MTILEFDSIQSLLKIVEIHFYFFVWWSPQLRIVLVQISPSVFRFLVSKVTSYLQIWFCGILSTNNFLFTISFQEPFIIQLHFIVLYLPIVLYQYCKSWIVCNIALFFKVSIVSSEYHLLNMKRIFICCTTLYSI